VCVFSVEVERERASQNSILLQRYTIVVPPGLFFTERGPSLRESTQHIAHMGDNTGHNNKSNNNKIACEVFLGVAIYFTLALLVSHLPCCIHRCSTFIHFVTKKAEQVAPETDLL
jgi:hypothetical protein